MRKPLVVGVSAVLALAGCAGTGGSAGVATDPAVTSVPFTTDPGAVSPPPGTSAVSSTSSTEALPPTSSTPSPTTTAPPPAPEQVVFQVRTDGGYVPQLVTALRAPSVTVYADGAVYIGEPDDSWGTPPRLLVGRSDPAEIAAMAAEVAADGLLTRDFGSPSVTDMPDTTVTLRSPAGEQSGRVYALEFGTEFREGLSDEQVAWRTQLRALVDDLRALAADSREWTPEQVRVLTVPYGNEPTGSDPVWPGPDLAPSQASPRWPDGCLGVSDGAADLYAAARANPAATWTTPSGPMTLAVVAVLPGETAC